MSERLTIKKLGINGEGIGYINNKICFVDGALPDEQVEVKITEQKPKYYKGELIRILKPSIYRKKVTCKENKGCQGCSLLHLDYDHQLIAKKQWIEESIKKYSNFRSGCIEDVIRCDEPLHYRKVVRLPIVNFNHSLRVGVYQRESHYLSLMEDCLLQSETINTVLKKILKIFNDHGLKDYYEKFKTGLRFIEMREANDQVQVLIICGKDGIAKDVMKEICAIKNVVSAFYSINTSRLDFRYEGYKKVYGSSMMNYYLNDQKFVCSIKSDFPMNREMEEKKINCVKGLIDENQSVISLNCGNGTLELSLDNPIVAIDERDDHIHDARENANQAKKDNVRWIHGKIDDEVVKRCKKYAYDVLILQAAKREMSQAVVDSIILSKVKEFIYITPHYSTMAKEINLLSDYYDVETIIPLDYEPYTSNVLTIVKMVRS